MSCLTFCNHFACARVCVFLCKWDNTKENRRVFSLEFAHTAHKTRRGDYLLSNHVQSSAKFHLSSPTRKPLTTPSRCLHLHYIFMSKLWHTEMQTGVKDATHKQTSIVHPLEHLPENLRVTCCSLGMSAPQHLLRKHFPKQFTRLRRSSPRFHTKENRPEILLTSMIFWTFFKVYPRSWNKNL